MIAITSTYLNKGVLVSKVNDLGNGFFTLEHTDETVFSCQPDGSLQMRPHGTAGPWEQCQIVNNLAVFNPDGNVYIFGVV